MIRNCFGGHGRGGGQRAQGRKCESGKSKNRQERAMGRAIVEEGAVSTM